MYDLVEGLGGFDRINALKTGMAAVVQGPLFAAIEDSWARPSIGSARQKVCARVCGLEFPAIVNQFETPDLVPGPAARDSAP